MFLFIPKTIFQLIFSLIKLAFIIATIFLLIMFWPNIKSLFGYTNPTQKIEATTTKIEKDPISVDPSNTKTKDNLITNSVPTNTTDNNTSESNNDDSIKTNIIDASDTKKIEDLDSNTINDSDV